MIDGHIIIHDTHQGSISQLTRLVPSRCISTVALQYARLGQVTPVKQTVTKNVSPSIMHLRGRICGDVVFFQITTIFCIPTQTSEKHSPLCRAVKTMWSALVRW